jgi:hypothetical protein
MPAKRMALLGRIRFFGLLNLLPVLWNQGRSTIPVNSSQFALTVSHMLNTLLFQVNIYEPFTCIAVPLLLSFATLVAGLIPARDGTRVEQRSPYAPNKSLDFVLCSPVTSSDFCEQSR